MATVIGKPLNKFLTTSESTIMMTSILRQTYRCFLCITAVLVGPEVKADLVINVEEVAGDVVVDYAGQLNVSGLIVDTVSNNGGPQTRDSQRLLSASGGGLINLFPANDPLAWFLSPFSSGPAFGWMTADIDADSASGSSILLVSDIDRLSSPFRLSSADIIGDLWSGSGSMRFNATTIDAMGLDLSVDRVWTIDNAAADTITITAVPEPASTVALCAIAGVASLRRCRRLPKRRS